jgi:16S rRNA (guanine527-N7)-methyltransferase
MADQERLRSVLAEHVRLGFIGAASLDASIAHAEAFLSVLRPAARLLDLGSGGGLPGLVLALLLPESTFVLLDASERRTDALRRAVAALDLTGRVEVVTERAEVAGRHPAHRGRYDAVVSRGFAAPAVTSECAAPFLVVGGQLVVSAPPGEPVRWPASPLGELGLAVDEPGDRKTEGSASFVSLTQVSTCPDRFPRLAIRRPLF